jgi:hypothetical protein
MMEYWNNGEIVKESGIIKKMQSWNNRKTIKTFIPNIPFFQYSSIPAFHEDFIGG